MEEYYYIEPKHLYPDKFIFWGLRAWYALTAPSWMFMDVWVTEGSLWNRREYTCIPYLNKVGG